jgi:hypothetical protein
MKLGNLPGIPQGNFAEYSEYQQFEQFSAIFHARIASFFSVIRTVLAVHSLYLLLGMELEKMENCKA